ncbi:MAG: hypothetical protein H0V47_08820 [Chloroflexia bacterium]|nr:hypothetical protein [Chloroflexia bacterium]
MKASVAAATAAATSSTPLFAKVPISSPFAGFERSNSAPLLASTH